MCKTPLGSGDRFVEEDKKPTCRACWLKAFSHICDKCGKAIEPSQTMTRAMFATEKFFHSECFMCTLCGGNIGESEFLDVEGKQYHEKCAESLLPEKKQAPPPKKFTSSKHIQEADSSDEDHQPKALLSPKSPPVNSLQVANTDSSPNPAITGVTSPPSKSPRKEKKEKKAKQTAQNV